MAVIVNCPTLTEKHIQPPERLVSNASWACRKLRRYVCFVAHTCIVWPDADVVKLVQLKDIYLKLQEWLSDLAMYNVKWTVGKSAW